MSINLKTLIAKLNDTSRLAATRAASICMGLGQYEVDIEHLFLALLEQDQSDFVLIARRSGISLDMLDGDLRREIGRFKSGSARTPVFSRHLPLLLEQAWLIASLSLPQPDLVRSGHLLLALLTEPDLAQLSARSSALFARFPIDELKHNLDKYARGSQESWPAQAGHETAAAEQPADPVRQLQHRTPSLDQYTSNLTRRARDGLIDPVTGRESEIRQVIDILMRRRQNNPILTGDAGVGKTAVAEGLALRIADGDVPECLQDVAIHALDLGLLQAGASVKGEFESRLNGVLDEVRKSPHAIILFIDEAHTMIGAGGQAGQGDAANLLKPALARGELRTIAATTWNEYKQYFEKDAALARRFQVVKVEQPDEASACAMLRAMAPLMERHFGVMVRDEAVVAAVRLSQRYISGRQLPDKAVSVLDTACARVALARSTAPEPVQRLRQRISAIDAECAALEREHAYDQERFQPDGHRLSGQPAQIGQLAQPGQRRDDSPAPNFTAPHVEPAHHRRHAHELEQNATVHHRHDARLTALRSEREGLQREYGQILERWERERALGAAIALQRSQVVAHVPGGAIPQAALHDELAMLQGESALAPLDVDAQVVAEIVSGWTGIPLGRMGGDDVRAVRQLQVTLQRRVLGQEHAMAAVAQRIRSAAAGLADPAKPRGVFLFAGPSGTGKTETALALAEALYGGERKVITVNMNEYQEAHSVSSLKGSPPGYVGYGEGGVLTEAVRRNPYCVLLLDEFEKAHGDVAELFFQVFDKGVLDDAQGRTVDFRHAIIIATTNAASGAIMQACLNVDALPAPDELDALARPVLAQRFKPALLGRMQVVPFYPISDAVLADIIALRLARIATRLQASHHAVFSWEPAVTELLLARCTEADAGVRNVDRILEGTLLPDMADAVLARMADGVAVAAIRVDAAQGDFSYTIE